MNTRQSFGVRKVTQTKIRKKGQLRSTIHKTLTNALILGAEFNAALSCVATEQPVIQEGCAQ